MSTEEAEKQNPQSTGDAETVADAPPAITGVVSGPSTSRVITLLAMLGLLAYFNSFHGQYFLDDLHIIDNTKLGQPFNNSMTARPVIAITLAVNYWIDEKNPRGYHLFNLGVHLAAAIVLFDLVRKTLLLPRARGLADGREGWVAFIAALLWMVHPLNTQSVTYTIQRCESMAGLFFLLTIWCYLRGATASAGAWKWHAAGVLANLLGCGCKELMTAVPPTLLLFDRAFLSGSWRETFRARWRALLAQCFPPALHLALLFLFKVITETSTIGTKVNKFTSSTYALTQADVIWHYIRLSLWPTGLTLDYLDWPVKSLKEVWHMAWALIGLILLTTYGVIRNRMWAVPSAAFFIYLAPTSSIVPIQDAAFEHRMYVPLIAIVLLVVVGAAGLVRALENGLNVKLGNQIVQLRPFPATRIAIGLVTIVLIGFAMLTVIRNEDYGSVVTMFTKNRESRPGNARVRTMYGSLLSFQGDYENAEKELEVATKLPDPTWITFKELAKVLDRRGKTAQAINWLDATLRTTPKEKMMLQLLGQYYVTVGRPEQAVESLTAAHETDPNDIATVFLLAVANREMVKQPPKVKHSKPSTPAPANLSLEALLARLQEPTVASYLTERFLLVRHVAYTAEPSAADLQTALREAELLAIVLPDNDPRGHDVHAMILARLKRFPEAVAAEERAVAAGRKAKWDEDRMRVILERVELYRASKPYLPEALAEFRAGSLLKK